MLKFILIILTGIFFLWLAKWNLKKENYGEQVAKVNYLIWKTTAIIFIGVGGIYLAKEILVLF